MSAPDYMIVLAAADHIDAFAVELRRAHTVRGKWREDEFETRDEYEAQRRLAANLRRIAQRLRPARP